MPYVTQVAAGIREKLYVFGNDYDTPDGAFAEFGNDGEKVKKQK